MIRENRILMVNLHNFIVSMVLYGVLKQYYYFEQPEFRSSAVHPVK